MYIAAIAAIVLALGAFILFWYKWARYRFVGNQYLYALFLLAICITLAVISNIFPIEIVNKVEINGSIYTVKDANESSIIAKIGSSIFEAIKMMGFGFDREKLSAYLTHFKELEHFHETLFGVAYAFTSLIALFFTSALVALTLFKNFIIKAKTFFRTFSPKKEVYYLFSDSTVTITAKLAEELQRDGHIVVIYLSRASQLTQAGTEFKDNLVTKGFDVRIETYGDGLIKYIFGKSFNKYFNWFFRLLGFGHRKVRVFGLFSDDETSVELASSFKKAVINNWHFKPLRRRIYTSVNVGDKQISALKNPNFEAYISGQEVVDGVVDESQALLALISNAIGLKNVVNKCDYNIYKFIKQNKIGDSDFPYLLHHFLRLNYPITRIINYKKNRVNTWVNKLKRMQKKNVSEYKMRIINQFRVFLTYHESDVDVVSHYSDSTLHIVNTLSQYDMISTEFILANQLNNFIKIPDDGSDISDNDFMHVTFFGFGKINRPIFEKMTSAYQLWHDNKNKVHYHIIDKEAIARKESVVNRYTYIHEEKYDYNPDKTFLQSDEVDQVLPPFLYDVEAECDGQNLDDYNTIDNYIKNLFDKDNNRFNRQGFEIFVISVRNTTSDIKIASHLRKAILEHAKEKPGKSINKAVIFVRVANRHTGDSFFNNNAFVKSQDDINNGLLFSEMKADEMVPIVLFGENALMSTYISKHLDTITGYATEALRAYGDISLTEAKKQWLLLDKREALSNIATVYSLKPKLALFGFSLDKNYQLIASKDKYEAFLRNDAFLKPRVDKEQPELEKEDLAKKYKALTTQESMKHLAGLEHNRWVAAVAQIYNYGPMPIDDYIGPKYDFNSKTADYTLHVCMLSNAGLKCLRNAILREYKEDASKQKKAWNLTLVYDIAMLQKIFESLKEKEESKKK